VENSPEPLVVVLGMGSGLVAAAVVAWEGSGLVAAAVVAL